MAEPWKNIITDLATAELPFELLAGQRLLLEALESFVFSPDPRLAFVLNGYAGTGKTSVVGAFIKALDKLRRPVVLLAPTGRAAKVAQAFSGHPASTIHKRIYRGDSTDPSNTSFFLAPNEQRDTLFIVDEASLITDTPGGGRSLLSHLIHHVYSAPGCRLMLVGDEAQLPPVGQTSSTAMNPDRLRSLGLDPICFSLEIPVRQDIESGIIRNATYIRYLLTHPEKDAPPELYVRGYPEVEAVSSKDLADRLAESWSKAGADETLIVTRSNKRANNFNMAIRNQVMYAEEPLQRGDRIIISKNDYYWGKRNGLKSFIANGDTAEVIWVGKTEKAYGRYFTEVELRLADGAIVGAKLMLRSLVCDGPSIPRLEMEKFYNRVLDSYEGELSHKIKGVMEDPYYNSLQAKYAYCVTCHKAQGGQWKHVYIDMGSIPPDALGADFFRWLYTAITRATEKIFLINPTLPLR